MNIKNGNKILPKNNKVNFTNKPLFNPISSKYNEKTKALSVINTPSRSPNLIPKEAQSQNTYSENYHKKQTSNSINNNNSNKNSLGNSKDKIKENINNSAYNFTFSSKLGNLLNLRPSSPIYNSSSKEKIENEVLLKDNEENDKKLKENIYFYSHAVRKNEGAGVNTLFKVRTILLNWLKDSEQDNLEYSKFMTEKKIKYLLKNKDKLETRIKLLENEMSNLKNRKVELESKIGDIYILYETEELEKEIERFSMSYEIRMGKSSKMVEKFEQMKLIFPLLKEFNNIKEQEINKTKDKNELEKICKSSCQTLGFLSNYYKNMRKKINDLLS